MLQKRSAPLNFAEGLDTKTDDKQVRFGKFIRLVNNVFTTLDRMTKRNGYGSLPSLPDTSSTEVTTFGGNLTAIGNSIQAFSQGSQMWVSKGNFQPISLSVLPTVRSAFNETQCDSVIASNGLVCTVYTEVNNGTASYKYSIQDSTTGQNIVNPTVIPVSSGVVTGSPRVFFLGGYFIIVFTNVITAVSHLQYIAISINSPTSVTSNADIAASYIPATTLSWDGVVVGNNLYIAYNTTSGGQQIKITYLTPSLTVATAQSFAGSIATIMSICADLTNPTAPIIYAAFYDSAGPTGNVVAVDQNLNKRMTATTWTSFANVVNVTCTALNGVVTIAYEFSNAYSYDGAIQTHFLTKKAVTLPNTVTTGTTGSAIVFLRSVGLASKAFLMNGTMYMLVEYSSPLQPTYFISDISGNLIARFAYENGGGYLTLGLPQAQVIGSVVNIAYLYKDLIQSTNTSGLVQSIGPVGASNIYSQSGINLSKIDYSSITLSTSEIGGNLNISGGFLWTYDGQTLDEQGFHVFPDSVEPVWADSGGAIVAKPDGSTNTNAYYYQVTYEFTDAAGNIIRSAPSIPVGVTTTGSGTSGSITVNVPNLRLTYKTGVKIVIYRWSVANQVYYQVTSITAPTISSTTSDSTAFVDTLADASIIGNSVLYTTGGVIEDIAGPAAIATTLFDDRLWLIDAEDKNLLWYSKQVIENTPVEMSDLLTIYVAPSTGAQGSTGDMQCLFPMDDKIIISKKDALYYINGSGPDNTGANSQYSQPIFITSSVGSVNQKSFVLIPNGLMFQSDKGIWLLGRDLSTNYIGADVEEFNSFTVNSATSIPETTHVLFTLSDGTTLIYDYFVGQWGTFKGISPISSTLYQGLHTYIDALGRVAQETPGLYLDNGDPVLMGLTTSWLNLSGLQGYQRAYFFYLLGKYITPHKLQVGIAYDYNPTFVTAPLISPTNFSAVYGATSPYGQLAYGGQSDLENWRVFFKKQRCQAFQISIDEIYDPSFGVAAGAGLTLSGLNLIFGTKQSFRPIPAGKSVG